jgi:hypothetical protein
MLIYPLYFSHIVLEPTSCLNYVESSFHEPHAKPFCVPCGIVELALKFPLYEAVEEVEMGGACSTNGGEQERV